MQFPVKSILPPTKLQLCPDVPGVDQPGMAQGAVEHADEDRVFISSICSDYWSLQKAPEHVQQLQRCRGRERKGRGKKKKKITVLTSAERPTGIFLTSPDVSSSSLAQMSSPMGTVGTGNIFILLFQVVPRFVTEKLRFSLWVNHIPTVILQMFQKWLFFPKPQKEKCCCFLQSFLQTFTWKFFRKYHLLFLQDRLTGKSKNRVSKNAPFQN